MHINLLHLPLFNFAYLVFLSFLLNVLVSFIFIAFFHSWHLSIVLFSSLWISKFCSGRYNFWFPFFTRSIYYTLFLLDSFDFAYKCIYIFVYSVTLFIVVINLCLYVGLLQFYRVPPPCFLSSSFFIFSLFYNFNF